MRHAIRGAAAAVLLLAGTPAAAQSPIEGTWTADDRGARTQLTLQWGTSTWGHRIDLVELQGLTRAQIDASASTPVAFRVVREAGVFEMEGAFREGRGAGHFRFHPERRFAATLRGLGIEGAEETTDPQLMQLAISGASAAAIRELTRLDLGRLTLHDVIRLSTHGVTPEYVRSIRALGVEGSNTVANVAQMRIHGVTPEYVRSIRAVGIEGTNTASALVRMRIHGLTPEYVREVEALGFRDVGTRELLQMSIHRVRPEEVRELHALGYDALTPRELVEMRIHRVTPEFIRELAALGYRDLPRRQLVQMRIHGVTPEFIRQVRAGGATDASAEALMRMRIHGTHVRENRRERRRP